MAIPSISGYPLSKAIPENRVNWSVDPQRAVLLIHDMQQYFLNFYDVESELIQTLTRNIQTIKQTCIDAGIPVVYTAQPGDQKQEDRALLTDFWGPGLKADDSITRIFPALAPTEQDIVYTKWRYSAFQRTPLKAMMDETGRDQLIIVGIYAHIGCLQTAAEAFMTDIQAFMVSDAVADFSESDHEMALNYVAGRCGYVLDKQQLLSQVESANEFAAGDYSIPQSQQHLTQQLAALLEVPVDEMTPDDSLLDFGLDSVRMMSLVGDWQQAGLDVSFMELAAKPSLQDWWQLIEKKLT
ncbi:isochorismatase family protein [Vibrio owensii]|uniref:isochorismatase n=1 Tax=Vibrio owensii TaxID=696485 RepID=A0AAP9KAW2_9VIBR|nr:MULTISPECIES: isochorismatase family protein [Vibrio]AYO14463.1 isochorismatase family protein [Vibrio owensii]QGH47860.1 isochorismatase family protein [Vibrio owensii]CAD7813517.1 Involved in the biosynthesis of the catechol siderophore vibriobactin. Vibriobactin is a chelating compound involved in transporting iron from the bacterial environment into the cell cytoplasm [Vibrio sp. B1ASS3]CAE6920144.1 Involved in the biosynthesis of the catechol siderophore vibriobactin. Vibriobactin is a 